MPGYDPSLYGFDLSGLMQALGLSGRETPGPQEATLGDWGQYWDTSLADDQPKPFDWEQFAAMALKGMGKGAQRAQKSIGDLAPDLPNGPSAQVRSGAHRVQPGPVNIQDFLLPGLSRLLPRNPLVR